METQKLDFFQKISKLNFDLCQRAEINIQVGLGLNMHLYDDIRDTSSSLRGSTSSLFFIYFGWRESFFFFFRVSIGHCKVSTSIQTVHIKFFVQ